MAKRDQFPTSEDGQPLLLNPRTDRFEDHISIGKDGLAVGLTPRGQTTIDLMMLNRPALVERRKAEAQTAEFFRELEVHLPETLQGFQDSMVIVRSLNQSLKKPDGRLAMVSDAEARYLRNMLFGNVIGAMEAYLSDTLVGLVLRDTDSLRQFVETYHDYKKEK